MTWSIYTVRLIAFVRLPRSNGHASPLLGEEVQGCPSKLHPQGQAGPNARTSFTRAAVSDVNIETRG